MKKTIIGITTRSVDNINKVPQSIIDYLNKYDAISILIPDTKNIDELLPIITKIDGFIIHLVGLLGIKQMSILLTMP